MSCSAGEEPALSALREPNATPLRPVRRSLPHALPLTLPGKYPRRRMLEALLDAATGPLIDRLPLVFVRGKPGLELLVCQALSY